MVIRLQRAFGRFNDKLHLLVQQQPPLIMDQFDQPQPDLVILRQPLGTRKPWARDHPVVIEVSDATYRRNRYFRLPAYLHGGVPPVWIGRIQQGQIEAYDPRLRAVAQSAQLANEHPM
jgi:hypothetical protein